MLFDLACAVAFSSKIWTTVNFRPAGAPTTVNDSGGYVGRRGSPPPPHTQDGHKGNSGSAAFVRVARNTRARTMKSSGFRGALPITMACSGGATDVSVGGIDTVSFPANMSSIKAWKADKSGVMGAAGGINNSGWLA